MNECIQQILAEIVAPQPFYRYPFNREIPQAEFRFRLPEDYVELMSLLGPGEIRSVAVYIRIHDLNSLDVYEECQFLYGNATKTHPNWPPEWHKPYPNLPGLFPIASTDEGASFYWLIDDPQQPQKWKSVTIIDNEYYIHEQTLCEWILSIISATSIYNMNTTPETRPVYKPKSFTFINKPRQAIV